MMNDEAYEVIEKFHILLKKRCSIEKCHRVPKKKMSKKKFLKIEGSKFFSAIIFIYYIINVIK